jgi:hypothetical protein
LKSPLSKYNSTDYSTHDLLLGVRISGQGFKERRYLHSLKSISFEMSAHYKGNDNNFTVEMTCRDYLDQVIKVNITSKSVMAVPQETKNRTII